MRNGGHVTCLTATMPFNRSVIIESVDPIAKPKFLESPDKQKQINPLLSASKNGS